MKSSLTQRIRKIYDFADLLENKPKQSQSRMREISLAFFDCIWYAPKFRGLPVGGGLVTAASRKFLNS